METIELLVAGWIILHPRVKGSVAAQEEDLMQDQVPGSDRIRQLTEVLA